MKSENKKVKQNLGSKGDEMLLNDERWGMQGKSIPEYNYYDNYNIKEMTLTFNNKEKKNIKNKKDDDKIL